MLNAYIKTFGCQMNEQDSAQMHGLLSQCGYQSVTDPFEADLILLNTCSVREKAVHKVFSELGRLRPLKEDRPDLIIGIAGCTAEQEKENFSQRFPFLDLVFGPDHIRRLPALLQEVHDVRAKMEPEQAKKKKTIHHTGFELRQNYEFVNVLPRAEESPVKAFVNIQKGCDNICSFCIVPFVRGREVSRDHHEIISEIQQLVARGVKEIMLLGQNVNSYGIKNPSFLSFAELLEEIAKQTKLERLRFTTSHPKDVKDDLIDQFANNPILAPQFHLPIQSGSDRILKLMKRQYTTKEYLTIIEKLKIKVPGICFSSDMIVGFPSETEADFQKTLDVMREVRYDQIYSFNYSPRPYTKSEQQIDDVPLEVKRERLQRLQAYDNEILLENNLKELGRIQDVLVEEKGDDTLPYPYKGRSATNKIIHFKGDCAVGSFVKVKVVNANPHSLYAEYLGSDSLVA